MNLKCVFVFKILLTFVLANGENQLKGVLNTFRFLRHKDIYIKHSVKRSLSPNQWNPTYVQFNIYGKNFKIHLFPQRGLFTNDFSAFSYGKENARTHVFVNQNYFFEGYLYDDLSSKVNAYWEGENLVAKIKCKTEVYFIEPSYRHFKMKNIINHTMIAYRESDIKQDVASNPDSHLGARFCGFSNPYFNATASTNYANNDLKNGMKTHHRSKRQIIRSSCPMLFVADYRFYRNIAQRSVSAAINYIIGSVARVDAIYRATDFGSGYSGLGVEIKQIVVHTEPTPVQEGQLHYNMERSWGTNELLEAFSRNSTHGQFCLSHLITSISFTDGVLGLAWIASAKANSLGGICSANLGTTHYNTAWTSTLNRFGRNVLTQEVDIILSHEIGHNWGSPHDPETTECSPGSRSGGNFIMYTYSVSGFESNNRLFSPCSRRTVLDVLKARSGVCFQQRAASFCGNSAVEPTEECDAGENGQQGNDPCCDANCRLRPTASCSDSNALCCRNCSLASAGIVCQTSIYGNTSCSGDALCNGVSSECPPASPNANGSPCIDNGICQNGTCVSICQQANLVSCRCSETIDSCKVCCRSSAADSNCQPYGSPTTSLSDGSPCVQGSCSSGTCMREILSLTERLWNVIDQITPDYVIAFMRANIVLTIIVLSLPVYAPLAIIVACLDCKNEQNEEKERKWLNKDNMNNTLPGDPRKIQRTRTRRRTQNSSNVENKLTNDNSSISHINLSNRF